MFIGEIHKHLDATGRFVDAKLAERLKQQAVGFAQFVAALKPR